ncbi:tripartite tricarboxylate transporter TctB family protein [Arthrobacter sp. Sa2BUA2]|uniref:Tripartite tricarboxylate transporter TctB family protein n=1 Tax=Arthrobacter pullicola TaxID=2762224 RepID=A0ABR8YE41_9MICC|nr:tripartite tricarboxylate transporter TctB family protein [Arthrobacter pullicola]MBD8042485.1 tripartite tricarboxylate transporter TctB family protein [Arthrobacter pullicola]
MTTEARDGTETADPTPEGTTADGFWTGRSGLVVAGILAAIGAYLVAGIITMDVPEGAKSPGPTFFPILIATAVFVLAGLLAIQTVRNPDPKPAGPAEHRFYTDWKSLGLVFFSFLAFALLLVPVGWLLSAALLFWGVSRALGSKRPLFDIGLALVFSSCIQLAFGAGLGLNLPGGILEGIYG